MGAPPYVPPTFPASTAMFWSNTYTYDPLYASDTIAISANIAGALGVLKRGTVLFGPAANTPITPTTLLTTATGAGAQRCILAQDIDTTAGQVTGLVYVQGKFLDTAMTFTAAGAAADCANLWDFGVYVLTVEQRSGILVPFMKLPTVGGPLPQSMGAKAAKEATQQEVQAIKNAMGAFNPLAYSPPPLPGVEPPWAIAAFGEPKPTAEQQAKEKNAEASDDLAAKQQKERADFAVKFEKELSDLNKKQAEERDKLEKKNADALAQAEKNDAAKDPPKPTKSPTVPGTHN